MHRLLWLFDNRFVSDPHEAVELSDTAATWSMLLDDPETVADDAGKEAASVLCGARYFDTVKNRDKEGVDAVTCLVLDVDHDEPTVKVPNEAELRTSLEGFRAIVYASPGHTKLRPRWRVLLPLASPLPPKKHRALVRWLSENLVVDHAGCIDVESTGDPCRLGFVGVTKHPEDYLWWEQSGESFDWTPIPLEDEEWLAVPLGGLDRQATWTDRATALQFALRAYGSRGYEDVKSGEHRTMVLFNTAMELWWQWAAEDEDFVMTVLRRVNEQFPEAKDDEEVYRKMSEAHGRTVGPNRKAQLNGPYGSKREPSNTVSISAIKHLAKRLRRSQKPSVARVGDEMTRMILGETITDDPGTWRSALGRVAQELAVHFNNDTRDRIASFFRPCRKTMVAAAGNVETAVPTLEEIASWVGVKIDGEKKRKAEMRARAEDATRKNIESATQGKRDTKYTPQEWDAFQAPNGCGLTDKTVLLQCGRATWVFLDGTYEGPYSEIEFDAQGYTDLEAASDFVRTKIFNEEKGTWSYVKLNTLLQKHGSKCTPQVEYMCDRSYFRHEDRTLVVAGPAKNGLEPKFHPEVDQWLRVMTGRQTPPNEKVRQDEAKTSGTLDDYDSLCDWMACVTQLDHICAALYLQGPKGVGKGLLADGIARIWKKGAITPKAAFDHFNSLLTESPYIHANEDLPVGMTTALLRRVLAEREHIYTRKNKDSGKIRGCLRIIFTTNNLDIFNAASKHEKLQGDDVDAFKDRFVHIKVRQEARGYLQSLGSRHKHFVEKNMVAEHALWLNEKRWTAIQTRDLRFLVEGRNANVSNVVATNVESTSDVCTAIVEALVPNGGEDPRVQDWLMVRDGELWVNTPLLRRHISIFNPAARYTEKDIVRAVQSVSSRHRNMRVKNGRQMKMWSFRLDALQAWCENTPLQDWEDVQAGLKKLNVNEVETAKQNEHTNEART